MSPAASPFALPPFPSELVDELWEEILRDRLRVTIPMADVLFGRLNRHMRERHGRRLNPHREPDRNRHLGALKRHPRASGMEDAARLGARIIRDGTSRGLLNLDARTSAQILLLGWCQQEEVDSPLSYLHAQACVTLCFSLTLAPSSKP